MTSQFFLKNRIILFIFLYGIFIPINAFNSTDEISDYIYDHAEILTNADKNILNNKLRFLKTEKDIIFKLVIFDKIPDDYKNMDFEELSLKYFEELGLNKKDNNLMLIMSIKDRKIRVKLGSYYNIYYQMAVDRILKNKVIPDFRKNNFSKGIYIAINDIIKIIKEDMNFFKYYRIYIMGSILIIFFILFIIIFIFLKKSNKIKNIDNFGDGDIGSWK
ncbi:MAG: TPM domain-containing protein [Candidatus Goldbacteria bacterium]|nr:TPM domain-containing protein [Candidatus Goldiibacteriota bacterium]